MKKIKSFEITPYDKYINRRQFIKAASITSIAALLPFHSKANHKNSNNKYNNQLSENDNVNTYEQITTYNNYYEFGTNKWDPFEKSSKLKIKPWSIIIDGLNRTLSEKIEVSGLN